MGSFLTAGGWKRAIEMEILEGAWGGALRRAVRRVAQLRHCARASNAAALVLPVGSFAVTMPLGERRRSHLYMRRAFNAVVPSIQVGVDAHDSCLATLFRLSQHCPGCRPDFGHQQERGEASGAEPLPATLQQLLSHTLVQLH